MCKYKHDEVDASYDSSADLVLAVRIDDTVRLMKEVVSEFKSNNSVREI